MSSTPDEPRGRGGLEDEFFRREDQRLLERLRERQAGEESRAALAAATGVSDPAVLDRMRALEIGPETVAALHLVPLIEVAWADGSLDERERAMVLAQARESGLEDGSPELALLQNWLARKPEPRLLSAWEALVQGLCAEMEPAAIETLRTRLLERAKKVASASGGVLGLGSKVSGAEASALARLERAFTRRT